MLPLCNMDQALERLKCTVDLELKSGALYECKNAHIICAACFSMLPASRRRCPICRVSMPKNPKRSRLAENLIAGLKVNCPNRERGCDFEALADRYKERDNSIKEGSDNSIVRVSFT